MGTDFGIGKLQQKGYGGAMLEKGEDFGLSQLNLYPQMD
jgi:hypothetical protein